MSDMYLLLILLLAIVLPLAWFASEFSNRRDLRLLLGCSAIGISFLVAYGVGSLAHLTANVWYGNASLNLVDVTVEEIEKGNSEKVVRELKELQKEFHPSYEDRGRYDKLVEGYLERLGHRMEKHAMMPPNPSKEKEFQKIRSPSAPAPNPPQP